MIKKTLLLTLLIFSTCLLFSEPKSALTKNNSKTNNNVMIGDVQVKIAPLQSYLRVDTLDNTIEQKPFAYINKKAGKLKFNVLAFFIDEKESWLKTVTSLSKKESIHMPQIAILGTTTKMPNRTYEHERFLQEQKRYYSWFTLSTNTAPLTLLLERKANKKFKDTIGLEALKIKFGPARFSEKYGETNTHILFSTRVNIYLFNKKSNCYLVLGAIRIKNKIVFAGMIENFHSEKQSEITKEKLRKWISNLEQINK